MHPRFVTLFIEMDADDLLTEEQDRACDEDRYRILSAT